jgi:hypothetical protein
MSPEASVATCWTASYSLTITKGAEPLFAVLRLDRPYDDDFRRVFDEPRSHITLKEVLPTWEEAVREVERLNTLNADKRCINFPSLARYFPHGRNEPSAA